jgi:hypothetical protein
LPRRLERLKKSGLKKLSCTDRDARFLRQRGGFVLGYTGEIAVSDDHLIVAQRVTQNATDTALLAPMIDQVEQRCGAPPGDALADSGFFSIANIEQIEQQKNDAYVPDSNLACELNLGTRCRAKARAAAYRRMRAKLRSPDGQAAYARRKAVVEPAFGDSKTTTWNAPISYPWIAAGRKRIHSGYTGLQHQPVARHARSLNPKYPPRTERHRKQPAALSRRLFSPTNNPQTSRGQPKAFSPESQPAFVRPPPLPERTQEIAQQQNHQHGPQPDACASAHAPTAVAVVASAPAEQQHQNDNEYQHFVSPSAGRNPPMPQP